MKEEQKEETEGEKDEEEDEEDHSKSEDGHLHMESAEDTAVHDYTAEEASTTTTEDPSASAFQYDPIGWIEAVSVDYPRLDFKPIPFKAWFLAITLVFFLACLASIAGVIILGHRPAGVFQLQTSQDQLAFRYVSVVVGTATMISWRVITRNLGRLSPYILMVVGKDVQSRHTTKYRRNRRTIHNQYADNRLTLELGMFLSISTALDGHWLLFVSNLVTSVLTFLLVPLIATFVQVSPSENGWKAVISDKIRYTLISIYGLLALLTAVILARLSRRDTGLKWDPVSIADQLALVQGSNIWSILSGLEFSSQKDFPASLKERATNFGTIRLGYCKHRQEASF